MDAAHRIKVRANYEIRRILSILGCSLSKASPIYKLFWKIRNCLQPGMKYRDVARLVPITIYFYYKLNSKYLNEYELLEVSMISKLEFNNFKLQLREYLPQYFPGRID